MRIIAVLFAITFLANSRSYTQNNQVINELIGHWEGAFIKNNAYQKIELEFNKRDSNIFALQIMEEWHPSYGEFEVPVTIESSNKIMMPTGYGPAKLQMDSDNLEIIGQLVETAPTTYLHLKKKPNKPKPDYTIEEITINSGNIKLHGHLHLPKLKTNTAIILVEGRGCYASATQYNLYAKFLRAYGITVLAYQKRGNDQSQGDCNTATIEDLSNDVIAAYRYLKEHPNGYENIGVLGTSAGGWTMAKAEESVNFDFMISIVGPSTSVRDQQFQSGDYGAKFYKLSSKAIEDLNSYTELVFDAPADQVNFDKMQALLKQAEKDNWKDLLEDTDIANTVDEINNLWVRRHDYDPKSTLSNYNKPFLAIYGERDWIVPPNENVEALKLYFDTRPDLLTTKIAHNAEHGMEMESKIVSLDPNHSYWHFYRISPSVTIEIINFLEKHNLL